MKMFQALNVRASDPKADRMRDGRRHAVTTRTAGAADLRQGRGAARDSISVVEIRWARGRGSY